MTHGFLINDVQTLGCCAARDDYLYSSPSPLSECGSSTGNRTASPPSLAVSPLDWSGVPPVSGSSCSRTDYSCGVVISPRRTLRDRLFWIYFAVVLFITIIGTCLILSSHRRHSALLVVIWLLVNVVLLMTTYLAINICCKPDRLRPTVGKIVRSPFFVAINVVFAVLLVLSLVFVDRLDHINRTALFAGCLTLLGGLVILHFVSCHPLAFMSTVAFLALWLGLIIYVLIHPRASSAVWSP